VSPGMRLRPIRLSVYFRFSIHLLHAGPNADSDERYSDCDDNYSNHGINSPPFHPLPQLPPGSPSNGNVVAEVSVQEFGWGMPSQCSVFRQGCRVRGGEFDFHRLAGVVPIVTP
jgi:hypothetical protein